MNIFRRAYATIGIAATCLPTMARGFRSAAAAGAATRPMMRSDDTALAMVQNRGLEVRREGATPTGAK